MSWPRVIVHVDMDAFFASVEQLCHPEWRGKPVIVGADPRGGKGRGVVAAASYEARRLGVRSAMPISQAYKRCPEAIYVRPNGALYADYSRTIMRVLAEFSPLVQPISIDEAFLDVTGSVHLFGSLLQLGQAIKQRIRQATGLTASLGIAPSKSVAKIASDAGKPDGLLIVGPQEVQTFLDPLPVERLWGVGEKTRQRLRDLGIQTIGQLRDYPAAVLRQKFGKWGDVLWQLARGMDERPVQMEEEIKSISHEHTFEKDQADAEILEATLLKLCEKVASRLRKHQLRGKTVQLKIRFADFSTFNRNKTLSSPTNLTEDIYRVCVSLLGEFREASQPVRLLGVGLTHLVPEKGGQLSLWDVENQRKLTLEQLIDQLQERYGQSILVHAQTLLEKKKNKDRTS
ncbi:MAG: DNA polymerase IV [Calditrichaeota bacterium]|nr:MAG: DNA polymerase IV [Calditrichota bacterium]